MSTDGSLLIDAKLRQESHPATARAEHPGRSRNAARTTSARLVVAAVALMALSVGVTRSAWYDLVLIGKTDPESSHVILVPLVFVWLAWSRRERLRTCGYTKQWIGTLFVALGWLLWSTGYRYSIQVFWHSGAVLMALGALLSVVGVDLFIAFLPAFGALLFLVPVPGTGRELVAIPLQHVTAQATQLVAETFGMSIQRTGSLLHINGVDVAIAEACNGMRMVFTLLLACYVFTFVTPLRWPVRLFIVLLSPLIAVMANVVRLVPTLWAYGHVSREAADQFHDATGWAMLVVAFVGLMALVRLMRWAGLAVDLPLETR